MDNSEKKDKQETNQIDQIDEIDQLEREFEEKIKPKQKPNQKQNPKPDQNLNPIRPRVLDHIMSKNKRNNKEKKFFASASLTFYHSKKGELQCNQFRWYRDPNEGKNVNHLIGGKVEKTDRDILFTAIREFVEETNIYLDKDLFEQGEEESISNDKIEILSKSLYDQIRYKIKYYDLKVSARSNLYHRYFSFNVNWFSNQILRGKILGLDRFYEKLLNPDTRDNKELNNLIWFDKTQLVDPNNSNSQLLDDYYKNIDNFLFN